MRLKAKGAGLALVEDYRTDQVIDDVKLLSKGFIQYPNSFWEQVKSVETHQEEPVLRSTVCRLQHSMNVTKCLLINILLTKPIHFLHVLPVPIGTLRILLITGANA